MGCKKYKGTYYDEAKSETKNYLDNEDKGAKKIAREFKKKTKVSKKL